MNERLYLGVEIGGTKLQVVLGNDDAAIIDRRRYLVDKAAGGAGIREKISQALTDFSQKHRISAAGIGFGGPVDWRTGKICCSHHIEGWADFEIGRWMEEMTRVPVRVDNDANTAALAEATFGAAREANPVFYVTLGSGVGGGCVINKKIMHGDTPGEAEIGHIRLDKSGATVESRCSGWAVDKKIREAVLASPRSILAKLAGSSIGGEAKHLTKALEAKDELARSILNETADDLAFALSHVTHLIHPEMIVLGGGLSLLGDLLQAAVQQRLERYLMKAFRPAPTVCIAGLGEDVVPVGALLLARAAALGEAP